MTQPFSEKCRACEWAIATGTASHELHTCPLDYSTPQPQEWEKEFIERLSNGRVLEWPEAIEFIEGVLASQETSLRTQLAEKVRGLKNDGQSNNDGRDTRNSIIEAAATIIQPEV